MQSTGVRRGIRVGALLVKHPEVVAQRLVRYAKCIIASTDCGFGTFAGFGPVFSAFTWMKFRSLAEDAKIASKKLQS